MRGSISRFDSEFRTAWAVVLAAMLGVGLGLSPVSLYTIGIVAPALAAEFGWSFGQIMTGLSVVTVAVLIAGPLVGLATDRFGVRRVALTSVVLFGMTFMAFSLGNGSLTLYYGTWAAAAVLGAGTLPITWTRAINDSFQARKGLALGLSLLGTGLFASAVKPLGAWLLEDFGWRTVYVVIGTLPLVIAFPAVWLGLRDPATPGSSVDEQRRPDTPRAASTLGLSLRETLRTWRFWLLALCFLAMAFALGGLIPNLENILRSADSDPADAVAVVSGLGPSIIVGRVLGGWLIDRFWAPGITVWLLGAPAIACLMLAQGTLSNPSALLAVSLIGIASGVEYDLLAFIVARYFGMKSYGAIYGLLYGCFVLGAGAGPAAFGATFDRMHTYDRILRVAAVLFVAPALLMLLLGRYRTFTNQPESERALACDDRPSAS